MEIGSNLAHLLTSTVGGIVMLLMFKYLFTDDDKKVIMCTYKLPEEQQRMHNFIYATEEWLSKHPMRYDKRYV